MTSFTTEDTNVLAEGFAALMMKGNTLLAKNENMPPPFLLLGETV